MKQLLLPHFSFHHEANLDSLAESLHTQIIDHTIYWPEVLGKGHILQRHIGSGICLTSWSIQLNEPVEIIQMACMPGKEQTIALTCVFNPPSILLEEPVIVDMPLKNSTYVLLDPGNKDIKYVLYPDTDIRLLVLHIEKKWLNEQLNHSISINDQPLQELMLTHGFPFRSYPLMPVDTKELMQLFELFTKATCDILYLKGSILLLLSRFFRHMIVSDHDKKTYSKTMHYDKMKIVEEILTSYVAKRPPKLSHLASEVALSETSLKRYFKSVYGKGIYEYFLEKKMEFAFDLLTKKKLPVKEVAYRTGYEKCSSFTRVFKKHYRELPYLFLKTASS